MKTIDICHIYAGTSGAAGTYLHSIYTALEDSFEQEIFVNKYYPFNYGRKIFYKYSDLSASYKVSRFSLLRKIVRYIELLFALLRIYCYSLRNIICVVNYSLTSDLYIEYVFLKLLRTRGIKVIITCHDVIPFGEDYSGKKRETKRKFFLLADFLMVHNDNSINELINIYSIDPQKIYKHPFPVMDVSLFCDKNNKETLQLFQGNNSFKVAMLGHFRKEKGLQVLLQAWKVFYNETKDAHLFLIGNFPDESDVKFIPTDRNISYINKYVNDEMFASVIYYSDLIVLPYTRGTNSGIPSSIISLGKTFITSDIDMFKNNELVPDELMFHANDYLSLANLIQRIYELPLTEREALRNKNEQCLLIYKKSFKNQVLNTYLDILKNVVTPI